MPEDGGVVVAVRQFEGDCAAASVQLSGQCHAGNPFLRVDKLHG